MDAKQIDQAAELLLQARLDRQRITALPSACRPKDQAEAYQIQDRSVDRMLAHYGGDIIGYKIGCTSVMAQKLLGSASPIAGTLISAFARTGPAEISADDGFMRMIEAEIGFRLGQDLPPTGLPYEAATVRPALAAAFGAIEVVDSRYQEWTTAGPAQLIADNSSAGFWVYGEEFGNIDSLDLADHPVRVRRNGVWTEKGSSAKVLDNPLNVVAWLANHLVARGTYLKADQLLTTGTMIDINPAEKGDIVEADYGGMGSVMVSFV
ncbi:MAG: fumarylacetoacetate hydrolase family protein [Alphaproteobacteria bacterium]|nr:fumarylacetoacetate hydrolase family protein [Alphaproteobacteria bacterium]